MSLAMHKSKGPFLGGSSNISWEDSEQQTGAKKDLGRCLNVLFNFRIGESVVEDDEVLRLKFDNLKLRFLIWAKTAFKENFSSKIWNYVQGSLLKFLTLMTDENGLEEDYGLLKVYEETRTSNRSKSKLDRIFHMSYLAFSNSYEELPRANNLKTWRISNAIQYLTLMQLFKEILESLSTTTGSEWTSHEQKAYIGHAVATISSSELELVKNSGMDDNDLIARAASTQLLRLTQKSSHENSGVEYSRMSLFRTEEDAFSASSPSISEPVMTPQSSIHSMEPYNRFSSLVERSHESYGEALLRSVPISRLAERRILQEIRRSRGAPLFTSLSLINSSLANLLGMFLGPPDTPYEDGIFFVQFLVTEQYPLEPPKCRFLTRIYHPNIDLNGQLCLNILDKQWQPVWRLWDILLAIVCILQDPNPSDFSVAEVADLQRTNPRQFAAKARDWTGKYATGEWPQPHELERNLKEMTKTTGSTRQRDTRALFC